MNSVQLSPLSPAMPDLPAHLGKPGMPVFPGASAALELKPLEAVDAEAGVRDLPFQNKGLEQRRVHTAAWQAPQRAPRRERSRNQAAGKAAQVARPGQADDELADWHPVQSVLKLLREDSSQQGRAAAEAMLAERFDMVQSYNALLEALREADGLDGLSAYKKKSLQGALNEMMSDMMQRSSGQLRHTLQETEELHGALEAMSEEPLPTTQDLRSLIGGKAKGRVDVPLTPLAMLKALIRNFGAEHCVTAMESLRSRMMSGL